MARKIKTWIKKHYDLFAYLFFGGLTTVVNYLIYLPCYNVFHFSASVSNVIAWAVAVVFAYLTNKPFVFHSYDWSLNTVFPEAAKFVGCRIGSGAAETLILLIAVDWLQWNGNVWKLITSVLVVILNYIASKLVVFRKR